MIKKIITLGPKFSYSYNVAFKHYQNAEIESVDTIDAVFDSISKTDHGIVPIENMLNGSVRETFLALQKNNISIVKAFDYSIEHVIASQSNNFDTVMSHAQALVQCSEYVNKLREGGVEVIEAPSTSRAMEIAAEKEGVAAIGSADAAKYHSLNIIKDDISNKNKNITRFIEISRDKKQTSGKKTSIIITPQSDRSGLLFEILSIFKIKDINLTKIESIPTGEKMNDYIFYLDLDGCMDDREMQDAFDFLNTFVSVTILGSYNIVK
ncbi:MAG: prephenate dehydratase domain-containing protein [Patescibacteria group bacterium]|nr:prephenate dehydratase domain-containing protein [Patescibacteria group bacterium]